MKARLLAVGEKAPGWVAEGFAEYQKRLSHWLPLELVEKIVNDPEINFTVVPQRTGVYAEKLQELGVLKNKASSWKDYFFEEAYANPGS